MKFLSIALLLLVSQAVPSSASGTDGVLKPEYRIISFKTSLKEAIKKESGWKICGDYFAAMETTGGKVVHFTFEKGSPGDSSTVFTFAMLNQVSVSVNEKVAAPLVMVRGDGWYAKFFLLMNKKDYDIGLPCFVKGTDV